MPVPLEQQYLHVLLDYLQKVGELWWKERHPSTFAVGNRAVGPVTNPQLWNARRWNNRFANKRAFTAISPAGYHFGSIKPGIYLAPRVIWAWMEGYWPTLHIDHINGVRTDDRWENLRLATRSQQNRNRGSQPRCLPRGVFPNGKNYMAQIKIHGEAHYLGTFPTPEEAQAAYQKAAETLHGEFAFHRSRSVPKP